MSIILGNTAPNSSWNIAWQHGAAVTSGDTLSLSGYAGKIVVLLLTDVNLA
jgi:hypothetical protein